MVRVRRQLPDGIHLHQRSAVRPGEPLSLLAGAGGALVQLSLPDDQVEHGMRRDTGVAAVAGRLPHRAGGRPVHRGPLPLVADHRDADRARTPPGLVHSARAGVSAPHTLLDGPVAEGMPWLGTFHAISTKILRRHPELVGLKSSFTKSIIPTEPDVRIPVVVSDASLGLETSPTERRAAVSFGRAPNFAYYSVFIHLL